MGSDHHALGSEEFYGNALGLGPKALQGLSAPSQFSKSSAPSDLAERQKIADAVKAVEDGKLASKAAAKAAAKEKAKNKAYDQSRMTTLEPMLKQWGRDMREQNKQDAHKGHGLDRRHREGPSTRASLFKWS